jgi:hypothetical protein
MCERCPVIAERVLFRESSSVPRDSTNGEKHEKTEQILRGALYIAHWHVDFVVDFQYVRPNQECVIDVESSKASS